jgi:hypothetical protein
MLRPALLVPRWVLGLDARRRRLLLSHEAEHARAGDTTLLWLSALCLALMPWNGAVWWMRRRLQLALELDCDARVLARGSDVRAYAELLLLAARHRTPVPAVPLSHLERRAADLQRRIEAMTSRPAPPGLARRLGGAAVVSAAIFVACEAPRPEPVAPLGATPAGNAQTDVRYASTIDSLEGEIARLRGALDSTRVPMQLPRERVTARGPAARRGGPAELLLRRPTQGIQQPVHVVFRAADGRELARRVVEGDLTRRQPVSPDNPLNVVRPDDIQSVEVVKGNAAACSPKPCSQILVTLKPGVTIKPR